MKRKVISLSLVLMLLLNVAFPNVSLFADTEAAAEQTQEVQAQEAQTEEGNAVTPQPQGENAAENLTAEQAAPGETQGEENAGEENGQPENADLEKAEDEMPGSSTDGAIQPRAKRQSKDVLAGGVLENYKKTNLHKGSELVDGQEIDLNYPIDINIRFDMPVKGDFLNGEYDQDKVVLKGDYALIDLGKKIEFIGNPEKELRGNVLVDGAKVLVGHFRLSTLADGTLQARIDFDGDDKVYDGTLREVNAEAVLSVQVREEWIPDANGKEIEIFGHKYKAKLPKKSESISKSGIVLRDDKGKMTPHIKWTIEVEYKTEGGSLVDLGGYKVYDDLAANKDVKSNPPIPLEYKNIHSVMLNGQPLDGAYDPVTNKLEYVFPKGTFGKQTITYITDLYAKDFYVVSTKTIRNTAELQKENPVDSGNYVKIKERIADVAVWGRTWIRKRAGNQDIAAGTLDWIVEINPEGERLKGVKITDVLEPGMTFVKARLQKYTGKWEDVGNIELNENNDFVIGEIDGHHRLIITVKVEMAAGETFKLLKNKATITIEPTPGDKVSHDAEWKIGFGTRLLNKYATKAEWIDPEMEWRFEVPEAAKKYVNSIENNTDKVVKVYDLFVFEREVTENDLKDDNNQSKFTGLPAGMKIKDIVPTNMGHFKYVPNSFVAQNTGVSLAQVHKVYFEKNGKTVHFADLVEVRIDTAQENKDGTKFVPWYFTLKAVPMDRSYVHELQGVKWITNSAFLYHGDKQIYSTYTSSKYLPKMLDKQMLTVDAARQVKADSGLLAAVNSVSTNRKDGFDEDVINDPAKENEGAVVYRLVLNANQHPYLEESLGSLELKDYLPSGWEFTKIAGKDFLMYEAKPTIEDVKVGSSINQKLVAVNAESKMSDAEITALGATVILSPNKKDMTISLPNALDKSYVVLVAARPNKDKIKAYKASANSNIIEINKAELKYKKTNVFDNNKPEQSIWKNRDVEFNIGLIGKSAKSETGLVEWTVLANPYVIQENYDSYWLEDTLGQGMEMRLDGAGNVLESDYHLSARDKTASTWTILPKDSYTFGYNKDTKTIKVRLPEKDKAYKFIYNTEISALAASDVSNDVKIKGKDQDLGHTEHKYRVQEINAKVKYGINGSVEIYKIDQDNNPVKNARFTLTNDGTGKVATGVTSSTGTLIFNPIQPGTYTLKETEVPEGYTADKKATETGYKVVVEQETVNGALKITTTVDGEEYNNGKQLKITNSKVEKANLTVTKKVEGAGADLTKKFKFTVTFTGTGADAEYDVEPASAAPNGKIKSGSTFELADNEKITIKNLPIGLSYKVVETDYSAEGYTGTPTNASGTIQSGDNNSLFMNRYTAKINIPVVKKWVGPKKESVKVYLQIDGQDISSTKFVTLSEANQWADEFKNLQKYNADGSEIAYGVREEVPAGYEFKVDGNKQNGFIITNKNVTERSITVTKKWVDDNNATNKRPATITVNLKANGIQAATVTLPKNDGSWEHTFTGLRQYDDAGKPIKYMVEEVTVPNYTTGISGQDANNGVTGDSVTITNTITGKVSIPVTKNWIGPKASVVVVNLLADGAKVDSAELKESNSWQHTFEGKPEYKDGKKIVYTVEEVVPQGYAQVSMTGNATDGFVFTNRNEATTQLEVEKKWVGPAADKVVVKLLADRIDTGRTIELNANNNWKSAFTGLRKYDETDGHEIVYTAEEVAMPNYSPKYDNSVAGKVTITNTNIEKIDIPVTKKWVGAVADEITIDLLQNGAIVRTQTLKKTDYQGDVWRYTFENLPKYDEVTGRAHVYTISERYLGWYSTEITGDMTAGFTITNTQQTPPPPYVPDEPGGNDTPPTPPTPDTPPTTPNTPPTTPTTPPTTPPTTDIDEEATPEGSTKTPEVPLEDELPQGVPELPKTSGIPAAGFSLLGLALAALGLLFKRK